MADESVEFSEALPRLSVEEEAWLKHELEWIAELADGQQCPFEADDPAPADVVWVGPRFLRDSDDYNPHDSTGFDYRFQEDDTDGRGVARYLWIYGQDYGNPSHAGWLVKKFLSRFRPDQCWGLTWSATCSKPRLCQFGGGAVFVTADEVRQYTTWDFIEDQWQAHLARAASSPAANGG
jgi:hypothetical protein